MKNDVALGLERYAAGQIDELDLERLLARELGTAPAAAADILAAIGAAERAGNLRADAALALSAWVRSTISPEPNTPALADLLPRAADGKARTGTATEGSTLKGRYLLEKQIGAGGMGVVFRARDLEEERIGGEEHYLAIKVLQPEFREHPDALKTLYEEVRKTRELAHANIVGVYDCQQEGEQVFMTMQYLEGKTLEVLLDEDFARGMPWDRARSLIEGMGSALAYAHDRGVIHCDFKPSNVFISLSGIAKVLDFGIARALRRGKRRFDPGALGGLSPAYASAEMIRSWQDRVRQGGGAVTSARPDPRDDIYALACVVFELLTGRHPFDRKNAEEARQEQLTSPSVPGLSARQNGAIAMGLAFDRERRTARVEDFLQDLLSGPAPAARRRWPWAVAAVGVLGAIIAVGYFVVDRFVLSKRIAEIGQTSAPTRQSVWPAQTAISEKSVAVLPFVDMSEKKDQEYFSDGLSEELIDKLTKIPDLRVPARTSSFYFKGKSEDIPTIARRLMVAHVLEGSVRKSGMNLRITVQLVRADNGYHLWSQTYDRKLDDIFKVQDEIAGAVVSALKVSLGNSSTLKVTTPKNTEAYTLYLQGRAINRGASDAQLDSAAEYMRQATKADPTFAKAWAWLAIVLANEFNSNDIRGDAVTAEMRRALEQALTLDPNLADAHAAKAWIYWSVDWDWEASAAESQKAYDLDPTDASIARGLGNVQFTLHGESDTVLALYQKAIDLDPVNPYCHTAIGDYYMATGKLPEAETTYRKAIDLLPAGPGFHFFLGQVLLLRGEAAAALAEFQRDPDESNQRSGAAMAYFALGRRAEANAALSEMERLDATTSPAGIAETLAYRGEIDQAFVWLDRAYQQHASALFLIKREPLMKSLHGDRRWKAFLRKMKLPE